MTNEQYEKYKKLEEEVKPVKDFLFWCGDRYKDKTTGKYTFGILTKLNNFFMYKNSRFSSMESNTFEIPKELQKRIVQTIEEYVDEVEKEMEKYEEWRNQMNDRYLYRAKRIDNGEWVVGLLWKKKYNSGKIFISCFPDKDDNEEVFGIDPNTICQCTGQRDEDKKLIFEHDIVGFIDFTSTENGYSEQGCVGEVLWDDETLSFQVTERLSAESYEVLGGTDCKVIGNIFDNPDLLEVEVWDIQKDMPERL